MVCPNCSAESATRYCPNCGQRMDVKRISFKEGWWDFWARIYGFDAMFPRTMRDLTLRPGVAAKIYIERNRAAYYGPVGYYFLMITLTLLAASMLGIDFNEFMIGRSRDLAGPPPTGGPAEAQRRLQMLVLDNFKIFTFTLVVFQAITLKWYFRKSGYNVLEHAVMPLFTMGHMYWLTILGLVVTAVSGIEISFLIILPINVVYFAYGAMGLYTYQSPGKAFVKGILSFVTGYVIFILIFTVISLVYFFLDPEMLELLRQKK